MLLEVLIYFVIAAAVVAMLYLVLGKQVVLVRSLFGVGAGLGSGFSH